MNNSNLVIDELIALHEYNRRTGQTTSLIKLLQQDSNTMLIVHTRYYAKQLIKEYGLEKDQVLSLSSMPTSVLFNHKHKQIFFDGSAAFEILNHSRGLANETTLLKLELKEAKQKEEKYQDSIHSLNRQLSELKKYTQGLEEKISIEVSPDEHY